MYLDNASTTMLNPRVIEAMTPYLHESFGNPGSVHRLGREASKAIDKSRQQVAKLINCSPEQIVFTSSGTEANNLAILGLRDSLISSGRRCVVTSVAEHDSVLKSVEILGQRDEFETSYLGLKECGEIETRPLHGSDSILQRAGLISIMHSNNEIGVCNPYKTVSTLCEQTGTLFHTDCVQSVGYYNIDVEDIKCDFLSLSSHKINGPKGAGALFVKNPEKKLLAPIIYGGDAQEFGLRGGTQNVAAIVGFGEACEIAKESANVNKFTVDSARKIFIESLITKAKELGIETKLHFNSPVNSGKIVNFRFDGVDSETLILLLDSKNIYVSSGAACKNHSSEPSRVLVAKGLTSDEARQSIRVSFSPLECDIQEIINAAYVISESAEFLISLIN